MRHIRCRGWVIAGVASAALLSLAQMPADAVAGSDPAVGAGASAVADNAASTSVSKTLKADSASHIPEHQASAAPRVRSSPGGGWDAGSPGTGDLDDAEGVQFGSPPPTGLRAPGASDVSTQIVWGPDDRVRVFNTRQFPARAIVYIIVEGSDGNYYRCTGYLYGPSIVGTAGHCVYFRAMGGWIVRAWVYPGQNGSESPFGYCQATKAHSVSGWVQDQDQRFDYGALELNCTIGDTTGWFGTRWQPDPYDGNTAGLYGYPADKQPSATMWGMLGPISDSYRYRLRYKIDTTGGQSGAPVYRPGCGNRCVIAIHASGGRKYNYATRIAKSTFDNLMAWKYN